MNWFDFFNFFSPAHNEKRQADAPLCGRSMVEMLGVLAIIGVLSVGAMTGYSKAMLKYKLNKQTEQLTYLMNSTYQLLSETKFTEPSESLNITDIFIKLNLVPQEMIRPATSKFVYDAMGNEIYIGWERSTELRRGNGFFKITLYGVNDRVDDDTCLNFLNFSKEMSGVLWQTNFIYSADEDDNEHYDVRIFGDAYCKYSECLKDLTVARIRELCDTCLNQTTCNIRILWY